MFFLNNYTELESIAVFRYMDIGSIVFNVLITVSLIVSLIVLIISVRRSFGNNLRQQLRWITIVQVLFQAGYIIRLIY